MRRKKPDKLIRGYMEALGVRLARATCVSYATVVQMYLRYLRKRRLNPFHAGEKDIRAFLTHRPDWRPRRIKEIFHPVKLFYAWLYETGAITENPAKNIVFPYKRVYRLRSDILTTADIRTIDNKLKDGHSRCGKQARLLLELAYGSGLRRKEIAAINIEDIDFKDLSVRVTGKGDKIRYAPLTRRAAALIRQSIKGKKIQGPLFVNRYDRRMDGKSIESIFHRLIGKPAHAFRHACALHMLMNGCPSRILQAFLGHESISTTAIYTQFDKNELKRIVETYHPRGAKT